jgi:transportin-1
LVFILVKASTEPEYVRQQAGILLKNTIKDNITNLSKQSQQYIQSNILVCLADPQQNVRRAVASVITTFLGKEGVQNWPKLLEILAKCLDSSDLNCIDGAFYSLMLICEDHNYELDSESLGRPLNVLIPKFLNFFSSSHDVFRKYAVHSLNQFITAMPGALLVNMEKLIQVRNQNIEIQLNIIRDYFF